MKLLEQEGDGDLWLHLLERVASRNGWRVYAFSLMPNHVHLMLSTPEPNLGDGMRWLQGVWAQRLNFRRGRRGRVWADRFHSKEIAGLDHYLATLRYIDQNAVSAGLADEPAAWPWGSAAVFAEQARCPSFLATNELLDSVYPSPVRARLQHRERLAAELDALDMMAARPAWGQSPKGTVPRIATW